MAGSGGRKNDPNERKRKADRNELPRGKTVWQRVPKSKGHAEGKILHPDFKFTCQCGFSSKTTPDHKCPDGVWNASKGRPGKGK